MSGADDFDPPREVVLRFPGTAEPVAARDSERLRQAAAAELGVPLDALGEVRARRISFDARRRHRDWRVALDVWLSDERPSARPPTEPPRIPAPPQHARHAVVIGSGPAGLFCALDLLAAGVRVTVVERGGDVQQRRRPLAELNRGNGVDPESNYCFGEGGAGTYSDGKLYNRSGSKRAVREILRTLVAHGATPEILASWRPHIGSNKLPEVVRSIRESIRSAGGVVRFHTRAEELETREGHVCGVQVRDLLTDRLEPIAADFVVLASGHSAPDALQMAGRAGARLVPKGFALGVRGEHPQPMIDAHQYGGLREVQALPAAFYELVAQSEDRGVYSFCMCPGGWIVPTTTAEDRVVVNGMSLSRRDSPFANSGLVVQVEPEDWCGERGAAWGWRERCPELPPAPNTPEEDPLYGIRIQAAIERRARELGGGHLRAPAMRIDAFVEGARTAPDAIPTSYRPGVTPVDLRELLPRGVTERLRDGLDGFDRSIPGFVSEHGQLIGVETRTSSPVRLARSRETCEAEGLEGLYPAGEGAGYAGGIVSAALDGRRVAAAIAARVHSGA